MFTTKPAGSDKKLYKALDKQLNTHQINIMNHYDHLQQHHPDSIGEGDYLSSSASPPRLSILSPPLHDNNFGGRRNVSGGTTATTTTAGSVGIEPAHRRRLSSHLSTSPFGPLDQPASRKTFAYLISVLNASQPDHDFSSLMPEDFKRETSSARVINTFNNVLFGLGMPVPPKLWELLDTEIELKDCTIYSHTPPQTFLDDQPGTIWSIMWFFFNKKKKRVAHLYLKSVRHHHSPILSSLELKNKNSNNSVINDDYDLTYSSDTNSFMEDEAVIGGLEMDDEDGYDNDSVII